MYSDDWQVETLQEANHFVAEVKCGLGGDMYHSNVSLRRFCAAWDYRGAEVRRSSQVLTAHSGNVSSSVSVDDLEM